VVPVIGVLALQGDVREHCKMLSSLGAEVLEVRNAHDMSLVSGLVIPGGESTTMSKLIDIFSLREPLEAFIDSGKAVFGTCAGMIMLATEVIDSASGQRSLRKLSITVQRNAFGSQLDSFEEEVAFDGLASKVKVAFIRAPIVVSASPEVKILASLDDGRIVAVRQGSILATAFHPEITGETKVHEYFLGMVAEASA
jgi:5'-phosphate synthase pdxT subunit